MVFHHAGTTATTNIDTINGCGWRINGERVPDNHKHGAHNECNHHNNNDPDNNDPDNNAHDFSDQHNNQCPAHHECYEHLVIGGCHHDGWWGSDGVCGSIHGWGPIGSDHSE